MIQVLSKKKKDFLACCTYVTEVEFEVAEAGQPTRWLCYSDADFAGFVVTDRSSMTDARVLRTTAGLGGVRGSGDGKRVEIL